jgi:hypothetical protein
VNYEKRIREMLRSGILGEEEAAELERSLLRNEIGEEMPAHRPHTIEWVGVFLLGALILLFWLGTGMASAPAGVENVSQNLNAPIQSGTGTFTLFAIALLLAATVAYVALYLLARLSYGTLYKKSAQIRQLAREEDNLLLMLKALERKSAGTGPEASDTKSHEFIFRVDPDQNPVDSWRLDLEEALLQCRNRQERIRGESLRQIRGLTGALARLIGPLPTFKEEQ